MVERYRPFANSSGINSGLSDKICAGCIGSSKEDSDWEPPLVLDDEVDSSSIFWPQLPQNLNPEINWAPQDGHPCSSFSPQLPQNPNPSGFWNWHFEHWIPAIINPLKLCYT